MTQLQNQGLQIGLDNCVLDTRHGELKKIGVCSISVVHINLTLFSPVETSELFGEVAGCGLEVVDRPCVIWEVIAYRFIRYLLLEKVRFVEEKDD